MTIKHRPYHASFPLNHQPGMYGNTTGLGEYRYGTSVVIGGVHEKSNCSLYELYYLSLDRNSK